MSRLVLCVLLLLFFAPAAHAQAVTLKQGNPERKAILEVLRAPVRKQLKKPVIFKVDHLKKQGEWAFMMGVPQGPGGKKMDYRGTPYQVALDAGAFDDWICALFRRRGGKWQVVQYAIGATDVVWSNWDHQFKAPKSIFPYPQ